MTVRIRGVYATALTRLFLEAGETVVDASPPIRRRFDEQFRVAEPDVDVRTTGDRRGVECSGGEAAVEAAARAVGNAGPDAFLATAALPRGAVYDGTVERTDGRGVVVVTGDGEGYLPGADDGPREGETVRVQVQEPSPPWSDDRPTLDTTLRVAGTLVSLVADHDALVAGTPPGGDDLARLTETLSADVPDGWGVEYGPAATDAGVEALEAALDAVADRAERIDADAVADGDRPESGPVATPATRWALFGRETRFALDERRDEVRETMPGHHRLKVGGDRAGAAVDFAERVCTPEAFPVAATLEQFGPSEGDRVTIEHGKPDGGAVTLGRGTVTERDPEAGEIGVRREMSGGGTYDALGVDIAAGDTADTRFVEGRRWYPTVYRSSEGDLKGTYVNICTPLEVFADRIDYVDLYVDVIRHADGTVAVVDREELRAAVEAGDVPAPLAEQARGVADRIAEGLE